MSVIEVSSVNLNEFLSLFSSNAGETKPDERAKFIKSSRFVLSKS